MPQQHSECETKGILDVDICPGVGQKHLHSSGAIKIGPEATGQLD